ncbi:molybdate ABC transporter substrate-binding protein [Oribacterium sp. oral taxon 102]|uniref:molybdate ABC transporter substrate-binding protein n=1 Tax=Oribacterium sp. oral taxon 102 TaxID=671214 RepID=UPI0015BF690B|nr:molybdate ABC transporter substrate-binding protein [Oribacterium sp. oral taxon 102]NWO22222.1 molybdate ABC transporter substrate-binding protein [Oribacterium sp. oral taxon 102]
MKKNIRQGMAVFAGLLLLGLTACGGAAKTAETTAAQQSAETTAAETTAVAETTAESKGEKAELQVFAAASLNAAMTELAEKYEAAHPEVKILINADSSGKLLTQIEEGYACDVFFSAAQKQMNTLEEKDNLLVEGTRRNVVNNQLVVVSRKDSGTKVKGLETLKDAKSIALADGSVPAGRYTRIALQKLEILPEGTEAAEITTQQVSEALGGVEISEQSNVSKVLAAVTEGSCEVGMCYYSDTYGHEADLDILEHVSNELTGDVIYPIAQVKNDEASEAEAAAAKDFIDFVCSEDSKAVFRHYNFSTEVK